MKSILLLSLAGMMAGMVNAQTNAPSWTVRDCYDRTPAIGHTDNLLFYKCKFCGFIKTFTWDDYFWNNAVEPVLLRHIEAFHVKDISITTNWCDRIPASQITNAVNDLAASGDICRVKGHCWKDVPHVTLEYDPLLLGTRRCQICGLVEHQRTEGWK